MANPKPGQFTTRRVAMAAALFVVAGIFAYYVFPQDPSFPSKPGAWSVWLDNRWFLEIVRVTAVAAGLYIVISVLALTATGRWLAKFGSAAVDGSDEEKEREADSVELANVRIELLLAQAQRDAEQQRLENVRANAQIEEYRQTIQALLGEVEPP